MISEFSAGGVVVRRVDGQPFVAVVRVRDEILALPKGHPDGDESPAEAAQREVRELCFACPVRMECLADALNSQTTFGVWGGLTERERRALLRRYPEVADWSSWLEREDDELIAELRAQRAPRIIARMRSHTG